MHVIEPRELVLPRERGAQYLCPALKSLDFRFHWEDGRSRQKT